MEEICSKPPEVKGINVDLHYVKGGGKEGGKIYAF